MDMISGLRYAAAGPDAKPLHPELAAAFSLDGRTAVVTGAAMGIGQQTAITFASGALSAPEKKFSTTSAIIMMTIRTASTLNNRAM